MTGILKIKKYRQIIYDWKVSCFLLGHLILFTTWFNRLWRTIRIERFMFIPLFVFFFLDFLTSVFLFENIILNVIVGFCKHEIGSCYNIFVLGINDSLLSRDCHYIKKSQIFLMTACESVYHTCKFDPKYHWKKTKTTEPKRVCELTLLYFTE